MRTLSLIALLAATASPVLAAPQPIDAPASFTFNARDIADRANGYQISELTSSERNGDPTTRARDIADRANGYQISELTSPERNGDPTTRARDIADQNELPFA
ncbi:hypothetical protein O4H61_11325 [Roseovarius aestuarii]|nr:hypothetical protein [Roseovarius aestuarii]